MRRTLGTWISSAALLSLGATGVWAEGVKMETGEDVTVTISGEYRPRFEFTQDHDFGAAEDTDSRTISHRARLGAKAKIGDNVKVFVQVQDVRTWGEEGTTTSANANHFDLHQGWGSYQVSEHFSLKLGRQEIVLDNERLVGSNNWQNAGRSFDAINLWFGSEKHPVNVYYAKINEAEGADAGTNEDVETFMAHYSPQLREGLTTSFLWVFDTQKETRTDRNTLGAYIKGMSGNWGYRGELYGQFGTVMEDTDISAFLASLGVDYTFDASWKPTVGLSFDFLSGDDDGTDDKLNAFNTLWATNHKFYGYMDFFVAMPGDTASLGLNDLSLYLHTKPCEKSWFDFDFHVFMLAEDDAAGENALGFEGDFTYGCKVAQGFCLETGYRFFVPDKAMENLYGVANDEGDPEHAFYVMGGFKF